MKKLIFCCLVIFMGACKDKDDVEPEVDYAPEYVGSYGTLVVDGTTTTQNDWTITTSGKNRIGIVYVRNIKVSIAGTSFTIVQEYNLTDIETGKDSFSINQTVDVKQSTGGPLKHKVEGIAAKSTGANGMTQLNINMKISNPSSGEASYEGYLEFKKK